MKWINIILAQDEEVIFCSKAPVTIIIVPFVLMLLFFFLSLHGLFFWLMVLLSLVGVFQYFYFEQVVTNQRLITKYGFFYLRYRELPIEKIDNVTCWQSFTDKILGTGVVILFGAGMTTRKIRRITHHEDFRNAVYSQLSTEPDHYFEI